MVKIIRKKQNSVPLWFLLIDKLHNIISLLCEVSLPHPQKDNNLEFTAITMSLADNAYIILIADKSFHRNYCNCYRIYKSGSFRFLGLHASTKLYLQAATFSHQVGCSVS